jgi:hypothetical protein
VFAVYHFASLECRCQSSAMLAILVVVGANRVNHVNFVEFLPRTMQI